MDIHLPHVNKKVNIALAIIIAIIAITAIMLMPAKQAGKAIEQPTEQAINCQDKECFLKTAGECKEGTYTTKIAGVTIKQDFKNCKLTRTITQVDSTETDQIKQLKGQSMTCKYEKNNLHPKYADTISGFMPQCQGPLFKQILEIVKTQTKPSI